MYNNVFDEVILRGQMRAMPGDWNKLRRKLDALEQGLRNRETDGTRASDWAYRLEHKLLIEVLREWLLPAVLDDLVESLRLQREREAADLGVWAPLNREETERNRRRESSADTAVLAALQQHARKPSHVRVFEGLRALEDLHEIRELLEPRLGGELLVNEGKHLVAALETLLPLTVRQMIGFEVESRFRSQIEGIPIEQHEPASAFWHHHLADLGMWHPVWNELQSQGDQADPRGTWLVPSAQAIYEECHAQVEAVRAKKKQEEKRKRQMAAAAEKRKRQMAAAEQQRRQQEEADQRAMQTRLREEEEARRQEQERERRAEAEAEEHRIRMQREEEERKRQAEAEEVQETERLYVKEMKRRSRPSSTPPRERRPREYLRRWAECEWERWCKSRGVSPEEVSDEAREKFIWRMS